MKNLLCRCALVLSACLVIFACPAPAAQAADLDARLQSILADAAAEAIPVVVTFHDGFDFSRLSAGPRHQRRAELVRNLKKRAEAAQAPARAFLRGRGTGPIKDLWIINGLALTATPETILALAARPEVQSIRYDEVIPLARPEISTSLAAAAVEPNIAMVAAPQLWQQGFTGQGVTVATMDSGVNLSHPDLGPRWRGGNNSWFDPNGEHPLAPVDVAGHGTAVMGILVGGNAGGSAIGVAPGAQWIAVKIFDDAGISRLSVIHQGYQWLLGLDEPPDVVNNSWGYEDSTAGQCIDNFSANPAFNNNFHPDFRALRAAGIAVVFAAGNTGPAAGTSVSPANYPEAFAVGSLGTLASASTISDYSARGPSACDGSIYPEAVAPGFNVRTPALNASFVNMDGTSLAAPHVSGVMALLLSAFPETPVEALETALKESATDMGQVAPDNGYGYGLVDAQGAFNRLLAPPAPIPVAPADGATGLPAIVALQWDQLPALNGSPVTNEVLLSTSPDFSQSVPMEVARLGASGSDALLAGVGGFLVFFGVAAGKGKRRNQALAACLLGVLLMLLLSCGGGGGGAAADTNRRSFELTGLAPATTYFWKVTAVGALDGRTEGPVRSFTTR